MISLIFFFLTIFSYISYPYLLSFFPLSPHQRKSLLCRLYIIYIELFLLCRAFSAFCRRRRFTRRIALHTNLPHLDTFL